MILLLCDNVQKYFIYFSTIELCGSNIEDWTRCCNKVYK